MDCSLELWAEYTLSPLKLPSFCQETGVELLGVMVEASLLCPHTLRPETTLL